MKYNHDAFVSEWSKIPSENEQFLALKNYMFSLPDEAFDAFLMWRFEESLASFENKDNQNLLSIEQKKLFISSLEKLLIKADLLDNSSRKAA